MSTQTPMEVKKDGLRQTQDGIWKLTVTVHPNDLSVEIMQAPMGTRYAMALVEIGDDEKPVGEFAPEAEIKKKIRDFPRSRQMQKLVSVPAFQDFVADTSRYVLPKDMRRRDGISWQVKQELHINSSNDLDLPGPLPCKERWDRLLTDYEQATGRIAVSR